MFIPSVTIESIFYNADIIIEIDDMDVGFGNVGVNDNFATRALRNEVMICILTLLNSFGYGKNFTVILVPWCLS